MNDKQFQNTLALMLFAMLSVTLGAWSISAVTIPKPSPLPSQLSI
jgi:hypothetical protein